MSEISSEEFGLTIRILAEEEGVDALLAIPGVWECIIEDDSLRNAAIKRIEDARDDEEDEDENEDDDWDGGGFGYPEP